MVKWVIITGAGSGIGQALAVHLATQRGLSVIAVGRHKEKLVKTQQQAPQKIEIIIADVATEEGREKIVQNVRQLKNLHYLIHNAAQLQPVKALKKVTLEEWRQHFAVNVEGPLFLTQKMFPFLQKGGRILHISSGAAHHAYAGWGAYCTSKAALHMLYQIWNKELQGTDVWVGSLRPGVVDTPMQDQVRQADQNVFPALQRFIQLKEDGKLIKPFVAAQFIAHVLLDTESEQFVEQEWDIREHADLFNMHIEQ